ncbi:phosphocarrier HPr family protein [Alteribacter lacisalsi]|uniref:Phosphocarrier HPr family protein n=1 Tax=Alteribacter lacisalsi TaxID=2045244 RepID=A0A2W0H315_9BACI|nr:HPr family phosphocarrier protein [Alteribacter lacisalsi]PYZ95597.1 phosphocarrier HPr family protein [Alteribacter lacisalsi]
MEKHTAEITINLNEKQTIVELTQLLAPFKSDVYLVNRSGGNVVEANVKSLLGLVSLRIGNGDRVTLRAEGSDAEEALGKVVQFLS